MVGVAVVAAGVTVVVDAAVVEVRLLLWDSGFPVETPIGGIVAVSPKLAICVVFCVVQLLQAMCKLQLAHVAGQIALRDKYKWEK